MRVLSHAPERLPAVSVENVLDHIKKLGQGLLQKRLPALLSPLSAIVVLMGAVIRFAIVWAKPLRRMATVPLRVAAKLLHVVKRRSTPRTAQLVPILSRQNKGGARSTVAAGGDFRVFAQCHISLASAA